MRRRYRRPKRERLAGDLAELTELNEEKLNDHFRRLYGVEPPARLRRPLLIRAIAYRGKTEVVEHLRTGAPSFVPAYICALDGVQDGLIVIKDLPCRDRDDSLEPD